MNSSFMLSSNVFIASNKARGILYSIKRSFIRLEKEIFIPLNKWLVRPHLENAIHASSRYLKMRHPSFGKNSEGNSKVVESP